MNENQPEENRKQNKLPETGEFETTSWEYLIGVLIIISALILYYLKRIKYY